MKCPLKRGVDSDVDMLDLTGKTCEKGVKITFFGGNGVVRISTLQEKLLLIIPERLSPYTVLLNYFLHTINFIHTFPPNVLITHSPPYIPALLMVDHAVSFNHKTLHIYHCTRVKGLPNHTSATIKPLIPQVSASC